MPQTYVALDLETTGLDAERDAIIEIGAVRFRADQALQTFSTFVDPGRPIPAAVIELTGIRDQDVVGAPHLRDVLPRLARFVGQSTVVGHSVAFDLAFLRRHSDLFNSKYFDTFELAGVLVPGAERYSLVALSRAFGIEMAQHHRALDDSMASFRLFHALLLQAAQFPSGLLQEIIRHADRAGWAAAGFFREALAQGGQHASDRRAGDSTDAAPKNDCGTRLRETSSPRRSFEVPASFDVDEMATLLEEGGAFSSRLSSFEYRPQQVAMLRGVAGALSSGAHLLVEAPTGVGKSLAYLIPAVQWAVAADERVVISTNTINLQEQLHRKDLPDLAQVLPTEFRASVIKGRSHYLCPTRLQAMRRRGTTSPDEARVLARVLVWLLSTSDGDGDSVFLPNAADRALWRQLSAEHEGCDPERCHRFRSDTCYYYRARHDAETADLIIVNHALLLADIAVQNRSLPDYRYLIVDEAHHLEAATTRGLSFETDRASIHRLLRQVGRLSPAGQVTGLLGEALGQLQGARLPPGTMEDAELCIGKVGMAADRAERQLDRFFEGLETFVAEHFSGRKSQYNTRLRITSAVRIQPGWEIVEIAWDDAYEPLAGAYRGLYQLAASLDDPDLSSVADVDELQAQALGLSRAIEEAVDRVNQMITQLCPSRICWLELRSGDGHLSLHAAPLHVGPLVEEHLFERKESVILTSATLRTGGTFDYLRSQLNAWEADELVVGSPFDYKSSTLVYLVDDIPEPGQHGYQRAVEQGMTALFRATEGRALALFTSYRQLRTTFRAIRAPLELAGINVQAQGQGVSRVQLLENFRTGDRQVLMGTRSFWEGVDVPGKALSCLTIARLPFNVPSDPIFATRSETFDQPFLEYAVPEAILRFLQGFGRLIRTRTDHGVVVVFDKRLLSKSYGPMFIESLPDPMVQRGPLALLPRAAAKWLDSGRGDTREEERYRGPVLPVV